MSGALNIFCYNRHDPRGLSQDHFPRHDRSLACCRVLRAFLYRRSIACDVEPIDVEPIKDCSHAPCGRSRALHPDSGLVCWDSPTAISAPEKICSGLATRRARILLCSCFICLRTPRLRRRVCFGIGITRPGSTGRGQRKRPQAPWNPHLSGTNVADMVAKFRYVTKYYLEVKCGLPPETRDDNMAKMADWLLQNHRAVV